MLGQYDPDTKQLYVISDAATPGPMERITLAHEYTHALPNADRRESAIVSLLEQERDLLELLSGARFFAEHHIGEDPLPERAVKLRSR